jgi:tetratricopeptide (TPR) repeat protein
MITLDEERGFIRGVAVGKTPLAILLNTQGRYDEAVDHFAQTLVIFTQLNEPKSIATVLHQMAVAQTKTGLHDDAEKSYRQSLKIKVQIKDNYESADLYGTVRSCG